MGILYLYKLLGAHSSFDICSYIINFYINIQNVIYICFPIQHTLASIRETIPWERDQGIQELIIVLLITTIMYLV